MQEVVFGDTLKIIRFKLREYDPVTQMEAPTDLTNCTAKVKFKINGGTEKSLDLTIQSPSTAGIADLPPSVTSHWYAVGVAEGRVVVKSGSAEGPSYLFALRVRSFY